MNEQQALLRLVRIAVCGETPDEQLKEACTPQLLEAVYDLAQRHDLAHLAGQGASKLGLPQSEALQKCNRAAMQAFMRDVQLEHVRRNVCKTLENANIPFIPLKGSVLRSAYPESWMRTSCDIDILVKEEMLETAVARLTEELGYTAGGKSDHDISLRTPEGVLLELHYDTIQERYEVNGCREVLGKIWEDAKPVAPGSCHMALSDELFYFYHMAHMAKHFAVGGCGIRAFLDIWVMQNRMEHDPAARQALLKAGGLEKFARGMEQVADYWFRNAQPDEMTEQVSMYILRASLYGDNANRAALGQAKMGGKFKYLLLRRVFMPYDYLKAEYPILQKHKWLTPVYQPVRWARMIRRGGLKKTTAEWKANSANDANSTNSAKKLLDHLGL